MFWRHLKNFFSSKHEEETKVKSGVGIFWQNLVFWAEIFFQMLLENFQWAVWTCSRYLGGPPDSVLCVSKKIVTARRTNQILCQEKWKNLRFWKNADQNRGGIFWQNLVFWAETFLRRPLVENFLWTLRPCSRYLKGPPNLDFYVSRKMKSVRQVFFEIS